ncbi:histidinol dehydrogenase [Staphylococcus schleiferi subsp. coagulans]|uniref:histidinol dehydrogenase n=1 Tax=Staphylococcus coagulans TaxID=74706 RepID=UPI0015F82B08|nr:histidinol dehydrogenase [Staphylococcus coagulans]MBA8779739.1 histidinol dehydrogenase [Staphylococcus coagulans]
MMINSTTFLQQLQSEAQFNQHLHEQVTAICERVKNEGDRALFDYNKQFDHVQVQSLEIPSSELKQAFTNLEPELKAALQHSHQRIEHYQRQIKYKQQSSTQELYEVYHPIESVGIYVPGGKASYPSTVLMTATLAKVANVKNIIVVTPPQTNGIAQSVLAACAIAGVDHVYQVGGAQSIAALAYGTETIPKVDKIVGPGNQYVAYAKKYLYGEVGIDQIAGPSEIALIIDNHSDMEAIVYDVFAQAEHDEMARTYVLSNDKSVLKALEQRIQAELKNAQRSKILAESLKHHHYLIHTLDFNDNCKVMNAIAPEHASVQTAHPERYIPFIHYVGSLFIGRYAPEAIGDYIAGPSHVLPTQRTARFQHGLSVNDFLTKHTVIHLSASTYQRTYSDAARIAGDEQLINHKKSLEIRNRGDTQ